jgi:hypothetical protein
MANPANLIINECAANGSITQPTAQTIDTNGIVNCAVQGLSERLIIEAVNSAANNITVTVRAGTLPPAMRASALAVTVVATTGKVIIGPLESARFAKPDGSIDVDFLAASGAPNLAIRVYRLPRLV